ncbi:MAG: type III-B CRISPR module RAMP protein Cmr4 [Spirochaetales bacterium]
MKREHCSILTFYAIAPIHAGSGSMIGAIDLPIQRERHTNWPHIQASSVKGALRDHFRSFAKVEEKSLINFIFGLDQENDGPADEAENIPSSVAVSDAKLIAFPVRSNLAPFVWVTCPLAIERLQQDMKFIGVSEESPLGKVSINSENAHWIIKPDSLSAQTILLEDLVLQIKEEQKLQNNPIKHILPIPIDRLLLVSDEIFTYIVETSTEIQTQIKIDSETGVTRTGSLRYQELLSSDSLLYSVIYFKDPTNNNENKLRVENVKEYIKGNIKDFIQIGGDETLGRGICSVSWYPKEKEAAQ